jgi:hypothetical protein
VRWFIESGVSRFCHRNGWGTSQALIEDALAKRAKGNFFWITLVLEELSKAVSLSTAEKVLQGMPAGPVL